MGAGWKRVWRKLALVGVGSVFWLAGCLPCLAEDPYDLPRNGYFQELYNSANGLASSEATDIVQTPDGFIWIASYTGLTKYDGTTFQRYTAENGVCSVNALYVDHKQRVWLNTLDNGIARVDGNHLVFLNKKNGLSSSATNGLCELPSGIMAVATSAGIDLLHPDGSITPFADPQLRGRYVYRLHATSQGGMAGLTMGGDFFVVRPDLTVRMVPKSELGGFPVGAFLQEQPETFLIGTSKGEVLRLTLSADDTLSFRSLLTTPLNGINELQRASDGLLWVCADSGIGFIDADNAFRRVTGGLLSGPVSGMLVDYEQNVWFTSSRQGVLKVTPNRFFNINAAARLPQRVANAVARWQDTLYIATDQGVSAVDQASRPVTNAITERLHNIRVRHVTSPPEGGLLLSTFSPLGLVRWHPDGTISQLTEKDGLPSGMVRVTLPLANGDLAVGTRKGLALVRDGAVIRVFDDVKGLDTAQILCLLEEDGLLYVGTDGAGLFVLKDGTLAARYTQDDGLGSGAILRMRKDPKDGGLWVLTGNTVAYIKNKTVREIRKIPTINNTDVLFAPNGDMWLFCNAGIYVTSTAHVLAEGPLQCRFFGARDGLDGSLVANSFNFIDADGKLFLCTSNGVSRVDTQNYSMRATPIRLAIPEVLVDDVPVPVQNGAVTIPSHSRRLTIHPHALTNRLTNPLLSMQLDGFEAEPTIRRKSEMSALSYTNLRGGQYVFRFQLLGDITAAPVQTLQVVIHKELTLLERPEAWLGLGLPILLLTFGGFRLYVRHRTRALLEQSQATRRLLSQVIQAFVRTIEFKDPQTRGHSARVARYAADIAREMGLSDDECTRLHDMGMLHDVGKVVIPDHILTKPARLTPEEYQIICTHAEAGSDILQEISSFPEIAMGARYHHEHMDGSGYPQGLQGEAIPLAARIIAVADTYDAMSATRYYHKAASPEHVRDELLRCAGNQLDADIVEVMLRIMDRYQSPGA